MFNENTEQTLNDLLTLPHQTNPDEITNLFCKREPEERSAEEAITELLRNLDIS